MATAIKRQALAKNREALIAILQLANALFAQGQSVEQVVELMMPL